MDPQAGLFFSEKDGMSNFFLAMWVSLAERWENTSAGITWIAISVQTFVVLREQIILTLVIPSVPSQGRHLS